MPTISAAVTANLTANGNTTSNGTLSWTRPNIPAGSTINSVVVSGTYSWNGKGSVTVTINGKQCSSGVAFSVSLPTTVTSPYTITCVGNNKNASGNSFTWSNLTVTYDYTKPLEYFNVSVGPVQNGVVSLSQSGSVVEGTTIRITATPDDGYMVGDYLVNGSVIAGTSFVLAADSVVTVTFVERPKQILWQKDGAEWRAAAVVHAKNGRSWQAQDDIESVVDLGMIYGKGGE